jgi:outer membrane lipoprotein-sorting protein
MKSWVSVSALSSVFVFLSCSGLYAQMVADKVAQDYISIQSYAGTLVETGVIPSDRKARRVSRVVYQRPWKMRSEAIEPESMKGELFVYDGSTIVLWWPRELLGIRIRGATPPTLPQVKKILRDSSRWLTRRYAFAMQGQGKQAGQGVTRWRMYPTGERPFVFPYTASMARENSLPLKITVRDRPARIWYAMEYTEINFDVEVPPETFSFTFPPNAVVLEWDLNAPDHSLEEIKKYMNFEVRVPRKLPRGHKIRKIVKGEHCLPMMAMLMDHQGRWLSLTQIRSISETLQPRSGIPIRIGKHEGHLHFLGALTAVTWTMGNTYLTLIGNFPYPDLIATAASVK